MLVLRTGAYLCCLFWMKACHNPHTQTNCRKKWGMQVNWIGCGRGLSVVVVLDVSKNGQEWKFGVFFAIVHQTPAQIKLPVMVGHTPFIFLYLKVKVTLPGID